MAEDAVRLLNHLKIKKAHIVGYSMGAIITAKLLTMHPDRFLTATLGGHGGIRKGEATGFFEELAGSLERGQGVGPLIAALTPPGKPKPSEEQVKAISAMILLANDPKALAAVIRGFKDLAVSWDKLKANKVPTLALVGNQDPLKKGVDELKGKMGSVTIAYVKDADHVSALSKAEFLNGLREFLAKHRGR